MATYQFEGAGSSPNLLWESKPGYPNEGYFEAEWSRTPKHNGLFSYTRAELEYLGGHYVEEKPQPVVRRVETWVSYFGWAWRTETGFGFEMGPVAVNQTHYLFDMARLDGLSRNVFKFGTYFAAFYEKGWGPLDFKVLSSIGVLGMPQRQSSINEIEGTLDYHLRGTPWALGVKVKAGLIQLTREQNRIESLGGTPDAITLFRNMETDTKVLMFTIRRLI